MQIGFSHTVKSIYPSLSNVNNIKRGNLKQK